jgi:hypothetical protein
MEKGFPTLCALALLVSVPFSATANPPESSLGRQASRPSRRERSSSRRQKSAYRENGGSMKALLISLLTSDAFLYRKVER